MKNFEVRVFSSKNLDEKWYVYIYHNSKIIKKIYKGINTERSFQERMIKAETLKRIIEKDINEGWNPQAKNKVKKLSIFEALDFALDKKKSSLSTGSYGEYKTAVSFFKKYGENEGFGNISIDNCERYHIKTVLNLARHDRDWSARNYNKTLARYSALFSELIEWDIINSNPAKDIRPIKESDTGGYEIMSDEDHKAVFGYLKQYNFNYYIFCSVVYYMGIRPGELIRLKCKDVDINNGIIRISSENSKTNKVRIVPMIGTVKELLSTFDLSNGNNFLFGSNTENKIYKLSDKVFCPGAYHLRRAYPTKIWQYEVINKLGLKNKLYSLKHKGANDKLRSGLDLKTVSTIFGHTSTKVTEIYANHINSIRFEEASKIKLEEY